eukprot:scaffold127393_cov63-Phaeocystis_antarctica.AAC.3
MTSTVDRVLDYAFLSACLSVCPAAYSFSWSTPERGAGFVSPTADSAALKSVRCASVESSSEHAPTVRALAITARRTCFVTASSSASGRSPASHHRLTHWETAASRLATSRSFCSSVSSIRTCWLPHISTSAADARLASCAGSSSKPSSATFPAAFSSAGSVKTSARRHTSSALDGVSCAPITAAHASLSASTTRRVAASSTSASRPSLISHAPS